MRTRGMGMALGAMLLAPAAAGAPPLDMPRLTRYALESLDVRGCRIECFQNGSSIISRSAISQHDSLNLFLGGRPGATTAPRWLEIRPFNTSKVQTVLLSPDTACNLRGLTIQPTDPE